MKRRSVSQHRNDNKRGPYSGWLQRKAYHLSKVIGHVWASWRMRRTMRHIRSGVYEIQPASVAAWTASLEEAFPYAQDDEGDVWA